MAPALLTPELLLKAEQDTICLYEVFLRLEEEKRGKRSLDEFPPEDLVRDSGTPRGTPPKHEFDIMYRERSYSKSRTPILESDDNMTPDIRQRIDKITRSRTKKPASLSSYHNELQSDGVHSSQVAADFKQHPADDFVKLEAQCGDVSRPATPGPTDEQIAEAALKIAQVGDRIQEEYGSKMSRLDQDIQNFVRECGQNLTYELFAAHVNELVGQDRSWTNFMFILHLSRRIVLTAGTGASLVRRFFGTYIAHAFREEVASNDNVATFVQAKSPR